MARPLRLAGALLYLSLVAGGEVTDPASTLGAGRKVMDGGNGDYATQTCVMDEAQTKLDGANIAAQCCEPGAAADYGETTAEATCRRYVGENDDAGCIGGKPARVNTYAQAYQLCADAGLEMCQQSCDGAGCQYNGAPVWTSLPCMDVQVMDGGKGDFPASTCVTDLAQTKMDGVNIAAQCCDTPDGTCRRYIGEDTDDGCIAGRPAREHTYAEARQLCVDAGLEMCRQHCQGNGCQYNAAPVWTELPCGAPAPGEPTVAPTPAPTTFGITVLDGGKGDHPENTCVESTTQTSINGAVIATQCCEMVTGGNETCRRYVGTDDDDGCVSGVPPRPNTFGQAEALCSGLGLELCAGSCKGNGCEYNKYPVWTSTPCGGSVVAPPTTAAPTQWSRQVLDGGKGDFPDMTCVTEPVQTHIDSKAIVAQCCDEPQPTGACRRFVGSDDDAGCVAGKPPRSFTYADAEAVCTDLGLAMCQRSCKGEGCGYNEHPAWTDMPCPTTPAPTPEATLWGIQVMDGGAGKFANMTCADTQDITQVESVDGEMMNIAAQCCMPDDEKVRACRRYVGEDDDAGCIGGKPPRATTYHQAEQLCEDAGLVMCEQSCADTGCAYNGRPVWTSLRCGAIAPTGAPTSSPTASPTNGACDPMELTTAIGPGTSELPTTQVPQCVVEGAQLAINEGGANYEIISVRDATDSSVLLERGTELQFNHTSGESLVYVCYGAQMELTEAVSPGDTLLPVDNVWCVDPGVVLLIDPGRSNEESTVAASTVLNPVMGVIVEEGIQFNHSKGAVFRSYAPPPPPFPPNADRNVIYGEEQKTTEAASQGWIAAVVIACLLAPPLLLLGYAKLNHPGVELLYIKYKFSHTNPAIGCGYMNKQEYDALWERIENGGHIKVPPSTGTKDVIYNQENLVKARADGGSSDYAHEAGAYTGAYANGKPNGLGTVRYPNGSVYTGQWVDGRREGHGFEECIARGTVYEGQWKNDRKHGNGGYRLKKSGAVYDGEFFQDKKNGRGTCRFADGDVYTGQWQADLQHGVGTYLYSDGRAEVGTYDRHRDCGPGVRWSADRKQAWRMQDGQVALYGSEISVAEARVLAARIGLPVPLAQPSAIGPPGADPLRIKHDQQSELASV